MDANQCLEMLRSIKDVAFATVDENGKVCNRIIDVMLVENGKLYFCTSRGKDFYRQLMHNPNVAITGMNTKYQMIRLNGYAKKLENQKIWIDRIFKENPSMNDVYPEKSRYILEPFCMDNGQNEFFDFRVWGGANLGTMGLVALGGFAVEFTAYDGYRLVLIGILRAALCVCFRCARFSSWHG